MRILEICGSPRQDGNTEYIIELCKQKIYDLYKAKDKIDCDIISIYNSNISWCKGCRICFNVSESKCPHNDELLIIKKKMEEADIIIVGSPVYLEDISGAMKNWMDRMAFNCHRPFLIGKPVYVYTTSAAVASKHAITSMKRAIISWGGNVINNDNFIMGQKMNREVAKTTYEKIIEKRMHRMIEAYKRKSVTLYSLISFGTQKRYWKRKEHTADYNYWVKMKWFESDCIYYKPVKVNFLKKKAAILVSSLINMSLIANLQE
jgi:Multimeric flavodoxin WrbA